MCSVQANFNEVACCYSGIITTVGSTDREEKDRYTLEVQAKDGGNKVTAQIAPFSRFLQHQ